MELRQLELFVAVAEERNFRRAAERCRIAQPALTRRIQGLEREVGARLFERTTRAVELTPAGAALLDAAREALARLTAGADTARRLGAAAPRVVVADVEYANFPFVPRLLRCFAERHPEVVVERRELPPTQQVRAVSAGEVDVGFVGVPDEAAQVAASGVHAGDAALAFRPLGRARWTVALPADHPLARRAARPTGDAAGSVAGGAEPVPLAAYATTPLVLFPRYLNAGLYDWITACVRAAAGGAAPRVVQEPAQLHSALSLVAAGVGVMPSPFHVADGGHAGVVVRPAAGFGPGARICAVSRRGDPSPHVAAFLGVARDVARELRTSHATRRERHPDAGASALTR